MQQLIENLSAQPAVCIFLFIFIFLISSIQNYMLLNSLLKMHRSKSALKKLKNEYTFSQKLWFHHFKGNCRHAVKFCNGLVFFQKSAWICLGLYLIAALLFVFGFCSARIIAWLTILFSLLYVLPSLAMHSAFSRPIVIGRFKEFSFEKYHNTEDHDSLL